MDNKGISELVSYVLLVVIAVGLSVLVYNYLSAYVPKDKPTCTQDIALIVSDVSCTVGNPGTIAVTLVNKGLFKVDAAYIRFGPENRKVKFLLNPDDLYLSTFVGNPDTGLKPGSSLVKSLSLPQEDASTPGTYGLQIEPAVFVDNDLALCPNAVITQSVQCN
jgi:hypothetical protein